MEWLRNLDWGAIGLGIFVVAFVYLVVKATRKMREKGGDEPSTKGKSKARPRKAKPSRPPRPGRDETNKPEGDEAQDDDEDGDDATERRRPKRRGPKAGRHGRRKGGRRQPRAKAQSTKAETDQPAAAEETAPAEETDTASERERLTRGLAKTRGGFIARLGKLFSGKPTFDETMLDEVEEVLFTADIGARTADELIRSIKKQLGKKAGATNPEAVWQHLKDRSAEMLRTADKGRFDFDASKGKPYVLLVVGVNGTGKTTTIGKLAARFRARGKRVLLAAGDTFRAAAAEQLMVWGERADCEVVRRQEGADPAAVVVDALKKAKAEGYDVVICDTAGRLHTKVSLMEELQKVPRSMSKHVDGAPHETFIVLDATTGQNAITQAKMFREVVEISGIVLTKLDGTAKGGVVLGISHELELPVRFVGIGEQVDDLRPFDAQAFVDALYQREEAETSEKSAS